MEDYLNRWFVSYMLSLPVDIISCCTSIFLCLHRLYMCGKWKCTGFVVQNSHCPKLGLLSVFLFYKRLNLVIYLWPGEKFWTGCVMIKIFHDLVLIFVMIFCLLFSRFSLISILPFYFSFWLNFSIFNVALLRCWLLVLCCFKLFK